MNPCSCHMDAMGDEMGEQTARAILRGLHENGVKSVTFSGGGLTTYVKNWDSAPAADSSIDGGWIGQRAIALGFHSLTTAYATTATHTTFQDEGLTITASYRANRILRLSWNSSLFTPAGSQRVKIRLLRGSTTIFDWVSPTAINTIVNESYGFSVPFLGPATAASETFKVQIAAFAATAVQSYATASAPRTLLLEDLGPQ